MIDFPRDYDEPEINYLDFLSKRKKNNFWLKILALILVIIILCMLSSCDSAKRCAKHARKATACLSIKDSSSKDSSTKIVKIFKTDTFIKKETVYINVKDSGRADTSDPVIIIPVNSNGIIGYFMYNKLTGLYQYDFNLPKTDNTKIINTVDSNQNHSRTNNFNSKTSTINSNKNTEKVNKFGLIIQGVAYGFALCVLFVFVLLYYFRGLIKKAIDKSN